MVGAIKFLWRVISESPSLCPWPTGAVKLTLGAATVHKRTPFNPIGYPENKFPGVPRFGHGNVRHLWRPINSVAPEGVRAMR